MQTGAHGESSPPPAEPRDTLSLAFTKGRRHMTARRLDLEAPSHEAQRMDPIRLSDGGPSGWEVSPNVAVWGRVCDLFSARHGPAQQLKDSRTDLQPRRDTCL
ncbi:hypothetical protein FQA47_001934 [Oryzias melastigma]|uniref:Uncharacterized protein n=1 Tax=Oryzias melastigma TaxID=30732 RepID=A0A834FH25_ORYME|nr:hypothetical protein FQA47_001934 [Oryzias melastigma]